VAQRSEHGFPQKPSAVAYDPALSLLAVGTELGDIRMYAFAFLCYILFFCSFLMVIYMAFVL